MQETKLLLLALAIFGVVESKLLNKIHRKREARDGLCNTTNSDISKAQCFCTFNHNEKSIVKSADCYLTSSEIQQNDTIWDTFETIKTTNKIIFTATKGIKFTYIPTEALKYLSDVKKVEIKYGQISEIKSFAFANLSHLEDIYLHDSQIVKLNPHAFANHKELTRIILDTNEIVEINRDVFINLPVLSQLFLTSNKITTLHDRAFVHLTALKELELDKNSIFSLNSETFAGLKHLVRLELSNNALEVVGDNTFKPLTSLQYLNLDGNKIQMIDEKAFVGLSNLAYLSLARNKLRHIENENVFNGLKSLKQLILKGNKLTELKSEVMKPILTNFYTSSSTLDLEDNEFPCDCRLDWFQSLKSKTKDENLKTYIDNLKCLPNSELSETWKKISEADNGTEAGEETMQNGDFEYYDDTQLNGKLFYFDVRYLLNCTKSNEIIVTTAVPSKQTKVHTTMKPYEKKRFESKGVLDLSLQETTLKADATTNEMIKKLPITTTRMATVSENPVENKQEQMASDEAMPESKTLTHHPHSDKNQAATTLSCVRIFIPILMFRYMLS